MMSSISSQVYVLARPTPHSRNERVFRVPQTTLVLLIVVYSYCIVCSSARAEWSPLTFGIRSALVGSLPYHQVKHGNAKSKTKQRFITLNIDDTDKESHAVETAFFKFQDFVQQRTAQSAYLKRKPITQSKKCSGSSRRTELEFLELGYSDEYMECVPAKTEYSHLQSSDTRGGGGAAKSSTVTTRPLVFWENMICGAISRSIAQTVMHPANTMKTILQNSRLGVPNTPTIGELLLPQNFHRLTVGAGANFILSVPHGAVNFAVLEYVRKQLSILVQSNPVLAANERRFGFGLDFLSSSISTIVCSVVSTPQMMITDNIMAGNYPNLRAACVGLVKTNGIINGFYSGWWPGLVGKIPSYALTWTFFQQLKNLRNHVYSTTRPVATNAENTIMGCVASAATVCLMIPMDTIKTRLVAQAGKAASDHAYTGIIDCAVKVFREEGVVAFYRGLPPRLVSVVPMIGIQFGVNEFMRRVMLQRRIPDKKRKINKKPGLQIQFQLPKYGDSNLEEAMMEVAASQAHPYPVPRLPK